MRSPLTIPLLAAAVLACVQPARAEMVDIAWDGDGRFTKAVTVAPGKFVEACEKLAKGARVEWRFDAAAPLNFNIHYHVGKDVQFPEKRDAVAQGDGTLAVTLKQDYCWMWTNKGETEASLRFSLSRRPAASR